MRRHFDHRTRSLIRDLFTEKRSFTVAEASHITGIREDDIRRRLDSNELSGVSSGTVSSLVWSEVVHLALQIWPIATIFEAVREGSPLLPALLRPVQLCAWLPEYQVRMLTVLAREEQLDTSDFLQNHLLDLASAADQVLLEREIPGFIAALRFPDE